MRTKKYLKKKIDRLQSDNDLMQRIITNSPEMQELYDAYTKPLIVNHTVLSFQKFKAKRTILLRSYCMTDDAEKIIEYNKLLIAKDLFESIKENIIYEIDDTEYERGQTSIVGSICIGSMKD